ESAIPSHNAKVGGGVFVSRRLLRARQPPELTPMKADPRQVHAPRKVIGPFVGFGTNDRDRDDDVRPIEPFRRPEGLVVRVDGGSGRRRAEVARKAVPEAEGAGETGARTA